MTRFLPSVARIAKEYSLEHLFPHSQKNGKSLGFETEEAALAEDLLRAKSLRRSGSDAALRLAAELESAEVPQTAASSRFQRNYRLHMAAAILAALDEFDADDILAFTALPVSGEVAVGHLLDQDPRAHLERFRQQLNRIGGGNGNGLLWAVLEAEYEPSDGLLYFHLHGIAAGDFIARLQKLRKLGSYRPRKRVQQPLRLEKLKSTKARAKWASYTLKGYWKERRKGPVGDHQSIKRERRVRRLSEPHHTTMLLWLDRHSASDLTLFMGARLVGSKLRLTKPAEAERTARRSQDEPKPGC